MSVNIDQQVQNNLKVETVISSQSLQEEDEQIQQEGQDNENTNEQDSQDNNNNNKLANDENIKFSCKCGKYYSRNASLFNHIRIKHENKITEWKIFEGMRKQGRPKKDQNPPPLPGQVIGVMPEQQIMEMQHSMNKLQSKKDIPHDINNPKKFPTFPFEVVQSSKSGEPLSKMRIGDEINTKSQRFYQPIPPAVQNPFQFYMPQQPHLPYNHPSFYADKVMAEQQQQQIQLFQQKQQVDMFKQSLLEERPPRHSLTMDIIIRFKDIIIDSSDEPLTEKEEVDYLVKLFKFQHTLFVKYKIDYDLHKSQFEEYYDFLRFWMRYIKRDKIDDIFKEYISYQFYKIFKISADQSAVMERLQKIYEDFDKKTKKNSGNSNQNGSTKQASNLLASAIPPSNVTPSANNASSSQQPSSPSESAENQQSFPMHQYPLYHQYPKFYPPPHYPPYHGLQHGQPPMLGHLGFPPEGLSYPGGMYDSDPTIKLQYNGAGTYPYRTKIPYPTDFRTHYAKESSSTSNAAAKGAQSSLIHDKKHIAEIDS